MQFEQFKRRMESQEKVAEANLGLDDLIYHKFLQQMVDSYRKEEYPQFTEADLIENLEILQTRFGGFLDFITTHDCGGDKAAEEVQERIIVALNGMLDSLEELKNLPQNPTGENIDMSLLLFKESSMEILNINKEMRGIAQEKNMDIL